MVELAGAYMGAGRPLIPLMLDGDAAHEVPQAARPAVRAEGRRAARDRSPARWPTSSSTRSPPTARSSFYNAFCEPLPSMVFLTLLGLPLDDLAFLSGSRTGSSARPTTTTGVTANTKMIEYLYAELDRREASGDPGDDLIGGFITAEVDGRAAHARGRHRHHVPARARRARHRRRVAVVHGRLVGAPPRRAAATARRPALLPAADRGAHARRDAGRRRRPIRHRRLRDRRRAVKAGDQLTVCWAAANLDDDGFDDAARPSTSTARRTATSRSRAASTAASARTSRGWSSA